MLHRVRIDLRFTDEDEAQGIFDKAKTVLDKAIKKESALETSYIEIHRCYHDEDPTRACEIIERVEI